MSVPLMVGILGACVAAQIAVGVFFFMAYAAERREIEYLLFGLLCLAVATLAVGVTLSYATDWRVASLIGARLGAAGGVLAAALHAHFVLAYVRHRDAGRISAGVYALALAYGAIGLGGGFWRDDATLKSWELFGFSVQQPVPDPSPAALSFFGLVVVEHVALVGLLSRTYRAGKHEALGTLVGGAIATLAVASDAMVVSGAYVAPYLGPYGFLLYGFGVANTLLVRRRRAAARLEALAGDLQRTSDELELSYAELASVQDELLRKKQLASVGELAASIAHEVRNPLAVIVNAAANLKRRQLTAPDRDTLLGIIQEETARLNNLVADLLRFARPVNVTHSPISLPDLLNSIESGLGEGYSLSSTVAGDPEVTGLRADPELLRLVFYSLVENACQAMPGGGAIHVAARAEELDLVPHVRIDVRDEGHGMTEEVRARALDPFFTTRPSGTGLGLPIVERVVEAHEGRLAIESSEGGGTTVTVWLPIRRRDSLARIEPRGTAAVLEPTET